MNKPFAPACERNKQPILETIQPLLSNKKTLLEIGSGTGQHAVFMAKQLPFISWQTSDLSHNHAGIKAWIADEKPTNVLEPIIYDASQTLLPKSAYDCVFTANTFHIMSWEDVCRTIEQISLTLVQDGLLILYGPFKFNQQFSSAQDESFDQQLKQEAAFRGIRDYEAISNDCQQHKLLPLRIYPMPANNYVLTFKKA